MMRTSLSKSTSGFTLLEIMLVVAIIGLILGAAIYTMAPNLGIAQNARVKTDISTISTALMTYQAANGFPPTTEQGLQALVRKPESEPRPRNWSKVMDEVPRDPWDNAYFYEQPGKRNTDSYDLYSAGKDRQPGTADDIGNWKTES